MLNIAHLAGLEAALALIEAEGDRQCPDAEEHTCGLPGWRGVCSQEPNPIREPLAADRVGEAPGAERYYLGAEHVRVEGVRPLPVGDGDHHVVEAQPVRG